MTGEAPPQVRAEIEAALSQVGFEAVRLLPLSRYQGRKHGRYAFAAEAADGARLKVRHLSSAEKAAELERLRRGLEPAFAPVVARRGAVLVEEWVDGRPLAGEVPAARAEEAGALLGRLHAAPLADGPVERSTAGYRERARHDLELLRAGDALDAAQAAALCDRLLREDPGAFRGVLVHRDFCGENFIVDGAGRLVVVDNEWFEVGAAGFDVGRTRHRWPLPERVWRRFLAAYRATGADPAPLGFWATAATLFGARVFLQNSPERLPPLLALLRDLAAGRDLAARR
jgi:aminoglycoside phosphotransferase (APT) family kinase protein